MLRLNYYTHLFLNSKYKFLIHLFILCSIYLYFYNTQIVYCMTDGNEITAVAEAKEPIRQSHQVIALRKEITDYARESIQLTDQLAEQKVIIDTQGTKLRRALSIINDLDEQLTTERNKVYNWEQKDLRHSNEIRNLKREISILERNLNARRVEAEHYEKIIKDLNNRIINIEQKK